MRFPLACFSTMERLGVTVGSIGAGVKGSIAAAGVMSISGAGVGGMDMAGVGRVAADGGLGFIPDAAGCSTKMATG
jgi:hypothetical protein